MDKTQAKEAMRELTLMMLYLSRFSQGEKFHEAKNFYAWKDMILIFSTSWTMLTTFGRAIIPPAPSPSTYGQRRRQSTGALGQV